MGTYSLNREPVVARSSSRAAPGSSSSIVSSSVTGTNADLFAHVIPLWTTPDDVIMDVTYGHGVFWRKLDGLPHIHHDLRLDGVDCRALPEQDESVDVVVLDPPYRPTHGSKSPMMVEQYGLGTEQLDSMNDVLALYGAAAREAWRVLRPGGRVLVKCQDSSYSSRLHLVTLDVLRELTESGFTLGDQFIYTNPTPLRLNPRVVRAKRARRGHSVLWVAVKETRMTKRDRARAKKVASNG